MAAQRLSYGPNLPGSPRVLGTFPLALRPYASRGQQETIGSGATSRVCEKDQSLRPVLVPLILVMFEPATIKKRYIIGGLVFYGLSKVFEALDAVVFEVSGDLISGHSLKHVLAALGSFSIMRMFIAVQGSSLRINKNNTLQS